MKREKSIAVLPLVNLSTRKEDELFCDGMTEELINSLAKVSGVYVTSRTSSFQFKETNHNVRDIADQLGVRYIVEGSLRKSGNNFRLTIQLVNAEEDFHYWSDNFDFIMDDIFKIQDDVANEVREKFREVIGHIDIEEASTHFSQKSENVEAYALFLKAKEFSTDLSEQGIQKAMNFLDQALKKDPENSKYLASKATYVVALGVMGAIPIKQACSLSEAYCERALKNDPNNADANAIRGLIAFTKEGDLVTFYDGIQQSLKLKPTDTYALYFKSIVDSALKKEAECLDAIDLAFEVDPLSLLPQYFRIINLMRLRKYDDGLDAVDQFLNRYPEHINAYNIKGLLLLRIGKYKLALAHFCKMPMPDGGKVPYYGGMAQAFALLGNMSEAQSHLEVAVKYDDRLKLSYRENPQVMVNFLLSKFDVGLKHLKEDINSGEWYTRFYKTNPFFDPIVNRFGNEIFDKALKGEIQGSQNGQQKYAKSGLSEKEISEITIQLEQLLEREKPYLDPNLSLKKLAKLLDVLPNHLSQVINSQKNKNFFDFINSYRIKEIIEMINNNDSEKFTLLSLAMDAGFNSKSTFNASFKKLTGFTPSEYLNKVEIQNKV